MQNINPECVGTKLIRSNRVNNMVADALALSVARLLAAMMLTMWNRQVLVLHGEGFQLPAPCQCRVMT